MIRTVGEETNVGITSLPATAMISFKNNIFIHWLFDRLIPSYITYVELELLFKLIDWVLKAKINNQPPINVNRRPIDRYIFRKIPTATRC